MNALEEYYERIRNIEAKLLSTRYSDASVSREDALFLVTELMKRLNQLERIEMHDEPFPPKVEEQPRKINIGFDGFRPVKA